MLLKGANEHSGPNLTLTFLEVSVQDAGGKSMMSSISTPSSFAMLPRDLFAHEEAEVEWWYYHGHLHSNSGRFGFHLAFFRTNLAGKRFWVPVTLLRPIAYYAHFALTDVSAGPVSLRAPPSV